MKRYALIATTVAVGGAAAFQGSVQLQAATPGTAQNGNLNITGTARVGVIEGYSNASSGIAYGGDFRSVSTSGRGVLGNASAATGATYGGLFQAASNGGRAVAGIAGSSTGTTYGGFFSSLSNQGRGVYGQATAASGTTYGVYGKATSPTGYGVYAEGRLHATGVISGNGSGLTNLVIPAPLHLAAPSFDEILRVENTNPNLGPSNGIVAISNAPYAFGVRSVSKGTSGTGVLGVAEGDGDSRGGFFLTNSLDSNAAGVIGQANATEGVTYGVWGDNNSDTGYGVIGINDRTTGVTYGTYGRAASSAGWAVYAQGNFGASGTKSFRIDHPLDPENKYLVHYSAESPTPQNFYVGNVSTDAKGMAWVDLPDYFSEINKNFKYQLTVVEDDASTSFVQVKVGKKIKDGRFLIMTSAPNTEVSWRVDADRNDLYVRNRPPKEVLQKKGPERGTYQHPEFYGFGPDRGLNYIPDASARAKKPPKQS